MSIVPAIWTVSTAVLLALCACAHARNAPVLRPWKATCMLVFGDSTVDAGNNNRLPTTYKADFLPYGKDFFDGRPTGRFCNGRLATDFIGMTRFPSSTQVFTRTRRSTQIYFVAYVQYFMLVCETSLFAITGLLLVERE